MSDSIAGAVEVTGILIGDNTGCTLETGEAVCLGYDTANTAGGLGFGGGRSTWFKLTAIANGPITIITAAGGGSPIGDTVLTVIDGNNFATANVVGFNDDNIGRYSLVTFTAVAGTT